MRGWLRRVLLNNVVLKLLSLALAVLLFVVVHSEKQATAQGTINVTYTVPSGKVLASRPPANVRVAVTGPVSRLQRVRVEELGPVNVDLSKAKEGYFKFPDDLVSLPMGLKVATVKPDGFHLRFEPTYQRALPVYLDIEGEPAEGFRITGREVRPPRVMVSGPRRLVLALSVVHTQPLSLEGGRESLRESVSVKLPAGIQKVEPESVEASVDMGPVFGQKLLKGVPVVLEDAEGRKAQPSPATVSVRIEARADVLASLTPASLTARLATEATQSGRLQLKPNIEGLPSGARVVRVLPPAVEVRLVAARRAP